MSEHRPVQYAFVRTYKDCKYHAVTINDENNVLAQCGKVVQLRDEPKTSADGRIIGDFAAGMDAIPDYANEHELCIACGLRDHEETGRESDAMTGGDVQ